MGEGTYYVGEVMDKKSLTEYQKIIIVGLIGLVISHFMISTHTFEIVTNWDGPSGGGYYSITEVHDLPIWVYPTQYFSYITLIFGIFLFIKYNYFNHYKQLIHYQH